MQSDSSSKFEELQAAIGSWNQKSAEDIRATYDQFALESGFIDQVLALIPAAPFEVGATWLLKQHLQDGQPLTADAVDQIFRSAKSLESWESKLHLLQCMPALKVPSRRRKSHESFLRNCIADDNKFVRAWAYGAFQELALQYPEYRSEASKMLKSALQTEAASVKARLRRYNRAEPK